MTSLSHYLSDNPAQLLELIEYRATLTAAKLRQAAAILLALPDDSATRALTLSDLERTLPAWQGLVPDAPAMRDALRGLLVERYGLTPAAAPHAWARFAPGARDARPVDEVSTASPPEAAKSTELSDAQLLDLVADLLTWRPIARGQALYSQGDPARTLFVVVDGLVHLLRTDETGTPQLVGKVAGGSLLGERSLVLNEARSTTAYAAQNSNVAALPLATLQVIARRAPRIVVTLLAEMAERMRLTPSAPPPTQVGCVLTILPAVAGTEAFVHALAEEFGRFGSTRLFYAADAQAEVAEFGTQALELLAAEFGLSDWLQRMARGHDFVLFVGDPKWPAWSRAIAEQADRLLIVGRSGDASLLSPLEVQISRLDHPELMPPRELVLLHASTDDNPGDTADWLAKRDVVRHHHVAENSWQGVDRVGRFARGRAVGLVFGGGGMRAAACAGVAKVLEKMGIRADVVGGTSAGSLAAALYAMGLDVDTLIARTRNELMQQKIWMQPTLPLTSVMSAKRLSAAYQEVFGAWQMEDMWITPFTISGNLTRAEMVVHTTGPLDHAVRASSAIAGVMPPALTEEGDLLIDGGIFNNTPADVARSLVDSGPVIAVDLGFTKRQQTAYDYGDSLSGWQIMRSRINPFTGKIDAPSIVSIMMRANALGSINATTQQIAQADLLLQPPVSDYGLFDFEVFDDVVRAGYEYARAPIEEWLEAGGMDDVY